MSSGSAMGGLIPSLINVGIIGASKNSGQTVGFVCFFISTLISISCFLVSYFLQKNEYFKYHGGHIFHSTSFSKDKVCKVLKNGKIRACLFKDFLSFVTMFFNILNIGQSIRFNRYCKRMEISFRYIQKVMGIFVNIIDKLLYDIVSFSCSCCTGKTKHKR